MKTELLTWAENEYEPTSLPCKRTLYRRAQRGDIPNAIKEGGRWYVITGGAASPKAVRELEEAEAIANAFGL